MKTIRSGAAIFSSIALVLSAGTVSANDATEVERPDAPKMTLAEIRAFNAKLPKDHRYYIVCKREGTTGSLAKVIRTCQTREDIDRLARDAQDGTREVMDRARVSPGCPGGLCPG